VKLPIIQDAAYFALFVVTEYELMLSGITCLRLVMGLEVAATAVIIHVSTFRIDTRIFEFLISENLCS